MKSFVCFALIAVLCVVANANPTSNQPTQDVETETGVQTQAQVQPSQQAVDFARFRKAASYGGAGGAGGAGGYSAGGYGAASIQAPACPRNYLFSCQPNLAPVPCAAPAASYGSSGAYSAPVPTYVAPIRGAYGVPQGQAYVPQGFAYGNQYYI